MLRLLLASASPARTATLTAAGIAHDVQVSDVDEPAVLEAQARAAEKAGDPPPSPADQVLALARAKAEDVADAGPTAEPGSAHGRTLVLGCDSMLEVDLGGGVEVVGKPGDAETATRRWRAMRGSTGVLHTGHWLVDVGAGRDAATGDDRAEGSGVGGVSSAVIHFADLSDAEIDAYVATGEPLKVAGGFTVDGIGGPFVRGIEGDFHGVVGVSLPLLRELLGEHGVAVTDLWA
ncbi:Maf family protein [Georgenia sp. Z1491]|uniref:Maf family protein n=1 Tax=Georgenia sp. Z1491 TaxID=3416707 RepID=UPI003CEF0057